MTRIVPELRIMSHCNPKSRTCRTRPIASPIPSRPYCTSLARDFGSSKTCAHSTSISSTSIRKVSPSLANPPSLPAAGQRGITQGVGGWGLCARSRRSSGLHAQSRCRCHAARHVISEPKAAVVAAAAGGLSAWNQLGPGGGFPAVTPVRRSHYAGGGRGGGGSSSCLTSGWLPPGSTAGIAAPGTDTEGDPEVEAEGEGEPYLGPTPDLLSAMDALSYTRTFTQMCIFLENNYHFFRGPEVAAVVLQAANVSELGARRQVAAAMLVAERRAKDLEMAGQRGEMNSETLAGAVEELLSAGGPGRISSGGTEGGADDDTVLDELDAADQLLEWITPLLRAHIKRYPPDAVSALLASLAQLQQYDRRLMELAAEVFKNDPQDWLRRASPSSAPGDDISSTSSASADPWFTLVSFAGAYARLGHYDRDLMSGIAKLAVELMPQVSERADAEDAAAIATMARVEAGTDAGVVLGEGNDRSNGGRGDGGDFRVTETVVALLSSLSDLRHLDPQLMQAAGEYLAAFSHQLDSGSIAEVLTAFAGFDARNPPFYSLMLRRLLDATMIHPTPTEPSDPALQAAREAGAIDGAEGGRAPVLTPRVAGTLYRACVLISAMGDVPELAKAKLATTTATATALASSASSAMTPNAPQVQTEGEENAAEASHVGRQLSLLLRDCLRAYPLSSLHAAPLGRPTPQQLEEASAVPELLEAWEATGLLTVPQILSALQDLPNVEPLPPSALAAADEYGSGAGDGGADDGDEDEMADVVGGADAVAWIPPDALLLYDDKGFGSRSGFATRIAIKALDESLHCCRNVGLDADSDQDRPGPRFGESLLTAAGAGRGRRTVAPSTSATAADGSTVTHRQQGRLFRIRGPAWSELRCLEIWGWKVLVVPVGQWGEMDPPGRRTWLVRKLDELAAEATEGAGGRTRMPLVSELWI